MTDVSAYVDARALHPDFKEATCPDCGTDEWFKHLTRERWATDQWNCQRCGTYLHETLEFPCPECDTRMTVDGGVFRCNACDLRHTFPKAKVLRRLSSDSYPAGVHKPGVMLDADCPLCDGSVNGGPDGELRCDAEDCDFYAGQYQDAWYCYALWLESPEQIRVNEHE